MRSMDNSQAIVTCVAPSNYWALETSRNDGSVGRVAQQYGIGNGVNDLGYRAAGTMMTMNTSPLRNKAHEVLVSEASARIPSSIYQSKLM